VRASERDRPDVKAKREGWPQTLAGVPAERLVFLDETGANTAMTRTHGRCPAGERLVFPVPAGHWKSTTFVAALRTDGLTAPTVVDGAMDRATFEAWVEQQLVPTLRAGEVVVMDNLSAHTGPRVRELVEGAKCRLAYLPPYSPDLNPIEKAWSKLKAKLRAAAKRTVDDLWRFLGEVIDTFTPDECRNYYRSCGYPPTTPDREPL
jgi:transposase